MPNIVILDGYTLNPGDLDWSGLEALGNVSYYDRTTISEIMERAENAEVLIVNKLQLSRQTLEQLPKLKYIGVCATGFNNVDIEAAKELGIIVTNVRGYSSAAVAQLVFSLILTITNHAEKHAQGVRSGQWVGSLDWCYDHEAIFELAGKTLGILGLGDIGQRVAQIGLAFGMNVIAHRKNFSKSSIDGVELVSLSELFKRSDVLSLHCPLTTDTQGVINKANIETMKLSAMIINTGRGGLIIEQDLADALNEERLAAAGLDVLSAEPPTVENPLLKAKSCYITPHQAWGAKESRERLLKGITENLKAFLEGNPQNVVNL